MRLPTLIVVTSALMLLATQVRGDYWVATTGLDTNPGSQASPYLTISKALGVITSTSAPTTIYVAPGTYAGTATSVTGISNVAIIGDATSWPILTQAAGGAKAVFYFYNCNNITTSNFILRGLGVTGQTAKAGITHYTDLSSQRSVVRVLNMEVSGFYEGVQVWAFGVGSGFNDVLIDNVFAHDNRDNGGSTYAGGGSLSPHTNVVVRNCTFTYNKGDSSKSGNPSGSGFVLGGVNGGLIEYCTAHHNGGLGPFAAGPVGLWSYNSNNVVMQYCESYNNTAVVNDGDGIDLDIGMTNSVVQYCYSHGNKGAGYLMSPDGVDPYVNNTIRFCISENDANGPGYGGLHFYAPTANALQTSVFYANTVYNSNGAPSVYAVGPANVASSRVINNILYSTAGKFMTSDAPSAYTKDNILFLGNMYYTPGATSNFDGQTNLSAWRSNKAQETLNQAAVGTQADPKLAAAGQGGIVGDPYKLASLTAYKLQAGSPAIGTALDYATLSPAITPGARDFYGIVIPISGKYDIGAAAFSTATAPPTTSTAAGACTP